MADLPGFLVENGVGTNRKIRRLTVPERWCCVFGVWAIASMSPVRGYLLISEGIEATAEDFADQAGVSVSVARSCVKKMRQLGMIERDDAIGAEHVHDWHRHQPEALKKPSDSREAWRERKRRQRAASRDGHADVPRDVTPPDGDVTRGIEEKGKEGQTSPRPPQAGERESPAPSQIRNDAPLSVSLPVPPVGQRRSDWARYRAALATFLSSPAAAPAASDVEALEAILSHARSKVPAGTFAQYLGNLHVHGGVPGVLLLGAGAEAIPWLRDRFGREIDAALPDGARWQILDCGCGRLEAAA